MSFENMIVKRLIVHEVFQRRDDRQMVSPVLAEEVEQLGVEAMTAFRLRMTDALTGQSQSLKMDIVKYDAGSFLDIADGLVGSAETAFILGSKRIARKLAEDQLNRRIPGGMLIVFDGTVGPDSVPFLGVIKAETQAGFRRSGEGRARIVEFLQNIFLTPATRLYKIGIMLKDNVDVPRPSGWRAYVFDSNISVKNREAAAAYFYDAFLGCALPSDSAYETARFFDLTKEFVVRSPLDPEDKRSAISSLFTFVRDNRLPTFTADEFALQHLPPDIHDKYNEFLIRKKFTAKAVLRDTSQMRNRLARRRLKFGSDIELSASPEALADRVTIEAIEGKSIDGSAQTWTRIVLKERLSGEQ
jgi:hypothetical protein